MAGTATALVGEITTMMLHPRSRAAIALATVLAGAAVAPLALAAAAAKPIGKTVAVLNAPEHPVPDAGESDDADVDAGLEAREAAAPPSAATEVTAQAAAPVAIAPAPAPPALLPAIQSNTLDAQYASLQGRSASPPPALLAMSEAPLAAPAYVSALTPQRAPAPSVALARRVVESAQAFTDYMGRAAAIQPTYADAMGVAKALDAGAIYEPVQLEEGAVAYVALAALQDPAFVSGVSRASGEGREALAAELAADPRMVLRAPGAQTAALRAAAALAHYGVGLESAGAAVKRSAYDIQHAAWSRGAVSTPQQALAALKARSAVRESLTDEGGRTLLASLGGLRRSGAVAGDGRLTPTVAKGLTLAALAVLGQAGEEHADQVAALLADASSAECLKMARLNLYQCLSVAGPEYEDVFCLGQHAMMETARCVATASGWTPAVAALAPVQVAVAAAPRAPASIMVPVALSSGPSPDVESAAADPADTTPAGAPPPMATANGYGAWQPLGSPLSH